MPELAERDGRWETAHDERYLVGYEAGVRSGYQRIRERHGMPTLRSELVKSGAGSHG